MQVRGAQYTQGQKTQEADSRRTLGPAHAVYFGTYELVKDMAGGNVDEGHHPLAAAVSGASATIASDALMNPFDGEDFRLVFLARTLLIPLQ